MDFSVINDRQRKHWKSASSEREVPWEKMTLHRQSTRLKHFTHSIQLIFESYFEIQHMTDLHRSFSFSFLSLLCDLLAMLSNVGQSSDNLASKRPFKFSKSIKTQPECRSSLCLSQCYLFVEFWKVKFGKSLKLSLTSYEGLEEQHKTIILLGKELC